MELNYTITQEDYFHYCMYSYDHSEIVTKQVLLIRVLYGALMLLISLAILFFSWGTYPLLYAGVLWVVSAVLIANTKRSLRRTNEKQYRKQIAAGMGAEFIGDYTLELLEDVIILSKTERKSEIGYGGIEKIGQDAYGMYIYCGSLSAILLPRNMFSDEVQKSEFLALLKGKCKKLAS